MFFTQIIFFAVVAENTRFFTISFAPPVWLFFSPDQWEEDRKRAMSAVSQVFFLFFPLMSSCTSSAQAKCVS